MGVDEAVLAAKMLRTKYVIPIHYNTWEPIRANPEELKKKLSGISEVIILKPGETASF
jgi:L-ascorbate metabolism protein UlaG (beta-lactamase superfamily)